MSAGIRSEDGVSLIELLIATSIAGLTVVVMVGSIMTGLRASVTHRKDSAVQSYLVTFAENVRLAPYITCGSGVAYAATEPVMPIGYSATPTVLYLSGNSPTYSYADSCTAGSDKGLQLFGLEVSGPSGAGSSVEVVKRNPDPSP